MSIFRKLVAFKSGGRAYLYMQLPEAFVLLCVEGLSWWNLLEMAVKKKMLVLLLLLPLLRNWWKALRLRQTTFEKFCILRTSVAKINIFEAVGGNCSRSDQTANYSSYDFKTCKFPPIFFAFWWHARKFKGRCIGFPLGHRPGRIPLPFHCLFIAFSIAFSNA